MPQLTDRDGVFPERRAPNYVVIGNPYVFKADRRSRLESIAHFDNSAGNRRYPDPTKLIKAVRRS